MRERRRRGGLLGLLLTAGLAVAGYGVATALAAAYGWSGSPETIALAGALVGAGLGLLLIGAIGRRAGFTGFLVTLLAVVTLGSTVSTTLPGVAWATARGPPPRCRPAGSTRRFAPC